MILTAGEAAAEVVQEEPGFFAQLLGSPILLIVVFIAIFYFLILRPQKKKEKAERQLRNSIAPGDEIVTIGGFVGRVLTVREDNITFETGADRTKMTVKKWAIHTRTSPEQEKPAEPEAKTEEK